MMKICISIAAMETQPETSRSSQSTGARPRPQKEPSHLTYVNSGVQNVGDNTKGPKINSVIIRLTLQDFRSDVHGGSASSHHGELIGKFCEPEVSNFKYSFLIFGGPEDILRLDEVIYTLISL